MNAASSLKTAFVEPSHCPPSTIGGLVPFSSVDWPGQLAMVVFAAGCLWRCHHCHNPYLQTRAYMLDWDDIFAFLQHRMDLFDATVFLDGEPLSEPHLP